MLSPESDVVDGPAVDVAAVGPIINLELEAGLDEYGVGIESAMGRWGGGFHPVGLACNRATVLLVGSSPPIFSVRTLGSCEKRQGRRLQRASGQGTPENRPKGENMVVRRDGVVTLL